MQPRTPCPRSRLSLRPAHRPRPRCCRQRQAKEALVAASAAPNTLGKTATAKGRAEAESKSTPTRPCSS